MAKGFASLTKEMKRAVSMKGGKSAQLKGTAHRLDHVTAHSASQKGVAVRRRKLARVAALVLLEAGITAEQLGLLGLTEEEYIYYGGSRRSGVRFKELLGRIEDVNKLRNAEPQTNQTAASSEPD